ncbi:hypothetical protein [Amycolatopsis sp. lyj-84]|uniref:hypothetical protein n=1 Tax=Amycolatopsis sp. lyj-84 TaxID=2789284 RepID=UPI00397D9BE6
MANDRVGAKIVHELFGTTFQEQGRGFYISLELLAICRGIIDAGGSLLSNTSEPIEYERRSHDLARRLAMGTSISREELVEAVEGETTETTLRALFSSLVITVPGRRVKRPPWFAAHFYPFVGELVHYDAVDRRGGFSIERYMFRNAGGFAYHVLRTDPDLGRRDRVARMLESLVMDSDTALGRIAGAIHSHDRVKSSQLFTDESESDAVVNGDVSPWPSLLRSGCDQIGNRVSVPRAKRVEQLLHWVPYCVVRHQLHLARVKIGKSRESITVDALSRANPIRKNSQERLTGYRWDIVKALAKTAVELKASDGLEVAAKYTQPNPAFAASPRAFFSETLAAVGALNATSGKRHFTFKAPMLEALLAATIPDGVDIEFEEYCRILFEELALVIGPSEARSAELTGGIDEADFRANRSEFRQRLESAGLLTHYSDATDLVHGEIR